MEQTQSTQEALNGLMLKLWELFVTLFCVATVVLCRACVISLLWVWFVSEQFGLPAVDPFVVAGLLLMVLVLKGQDIDEEELKEEVDKGTGEMLGRLVRDCSLYFMVGCFGYFFYLLI